MPLREPTFQCASDVSEAVTEMTTTRTAACPAWCCLDHSGDSPISHETRSAVVSVGGHDGMQFLEVRTVQYATDDSGADALAAEPGPFVEVAHHVNGRYRLINMSSVQARALAEAVLRCADAVGTDSQVCDRIDYRQSG